MEGREHIFHNGVTDDHISIYRSPRRIATSSSVTMVSPCEKGMCVSMTSIFLIGN